MKPDKLFCCVCQEYVDPPHYLRTVVRGIATEVNVSFYRQEMQRGTGQPVDDGWRAPKSEPPY